MGKSVSTIKILDPTMRMGFAQIPNVVFKDPDLSMQSKCVYGLLLTYAWSDGSCFPGQKRMSEELGCSVRMLRKYLSELKRNRLVNWKQRGLNKTNQYYLLPLSRLDGNCSSGQDGNCGSDKEYEEKEYEREENPADYLTEGKILEYFLNSFRETKGISHPNITLEEKMRVFSMIRDFTDKYPSYCEDHRWFDHIDTFFSDDLQDEIQGNSRIWMFLKPKMLNFVEQYYR